MKSKKILAVALSGITSLLSVQPVGAMDWVQGNVNGMILQKNTSDVIKMLLGSAMAMAARPEARVSLDGLTTYAPGYQLAVQYKGQVNYLYNEIVLALMQELDSNAQQQALRSAEAIVSNVVKAVKDKFNSVIDSSGPFRVHTPSGVWVRCTQPSCINHGRWAKFDALTLLVARIVSAQARLPHLTCPCGAELNWDNIRFESPVAASLYCYLDNPGSKLYQGLANFKSPWTAGVAVGGSVLAALLASFLTYRLTANRVPNLLKTQQPVAQHEGDISAPAPAGGALGADTVFFSGDTQATLTGDKSVASVVGAPPVAENVSIDGKAPSPDSPATALNEE